MTPLRDIAWLAGLLEGEAWFGVNRGAGNGVTPSITLRMTDRDIVERARQLCGLTPETPEERSRKRPHHKPAWSMQLRGMRAIGVMLTVYTFMGTRRKERIRRVLARWKASPHRPRCLPGTARTPVCHQDRPHKSRDLCNACYQRDLKQRKAVASAAA